MPASRARSRRSSSRVFRQTGGCGRHRRRRPSAVRLKRAETRRGNGPRLPLRIVRANATIHTADRRRRYTLGKQDRKSTRLNSSHVEISYAVFCLKKKKYKPPVTINCKIDAVITHEKVSSM